MGAEGDERGIFDGPLGGSVRSEHARVTAKSASTKDFLMPRAKGNLRSSAKATKYGGCRPAGATSDETMWLLIQKRRGWRATLVSTRERHRTRMSMIRSRAFRARLARESRQPHSVRVITALRDRGGCLRQSDRRPLTPLSHRQPPENDTSVRLSHCTSAPSHWQLVRPPFGDATAQAPLMARFML